MLRKWYLFPIFISLFTASCVESPIVPKPPAEVDARIQSLFAERKAYYVAQIKAHFENKTKANTTILYNIQAELQNLLWYASVYQQANVLEGLSEIALTAFDRLTETDERIFYYVTLPDGARPRTSLHPLGGKYRMWLSPKPYIESTTGKAFLIGTETILDSAQFDFLIARLLNVITSLPAEKQSPRMLETAQKFGSFLLHDQYERWIFRKASVPGHWQVKGWGCNDGDFSHEEHLVHLLGRHYGTAYFPRYRSVSYCNAFLDTDLWIITGVIELLEAHARNPGVIPIDAQLKAKLIAYVQFGARVARSRTSSLPISNFRGRGVPGANFEIGTFDDHPDMRYSGDTGTSFPGWTDIATKQVARPPLPAENTASDLSHARRWVHQFESMLAVAAKYQLEFPTRQDLVSFANQFAYKVFNRDFAEPKFSNFMNGVNGWYRVNYNNLPGFGYAPFGLSDEALHSGYAFWAKYNADVKRIMDARFAVSPPTQPGGLMATLPSLGMPAGVY